MIEAPVDGQRTEAGSCYHTAVWPLDPRQTALVLVDVWDWHGIRSHLERAQQILQDRIAPVVQAARRAGITVVYAPSPEVAVLYPQSRAYAAGHRLRRWRERWAARVASATRWLDWPPRSFRGRRDAYAMFARTPAPRWPETRPALRIPACIEPEPDDPVIFSGADLRRVARRRRILHLLYAGFAANRCLDHARDYSMAAMRRLGYNLILLRDCTTGIETAETVEGLFATTVAIQEIEQSDASTTSDDLLRACACLGE